MNKSPSGKAKNWKLSRDSLQLISRSLSSQAKATLHSTNKCKSLIEKPKAIKAAAEGIESADKRERIYSKLWNEKIEENFLLSSFVCVDIKSRSSEPHKISNEKPSEMITVFSWIHWKF